MDATDLVMPAPRRRTTDMWESDTSHMIENHTFNELVIGQSSSTKRTLTRADIQAFALVSGDVNPAHVDSEYADASFFHGVIGHGMWAGSLISAVLGTVFPGAGTIYLQQSLRFHRPVRIGDTLLIVVTVESKNDANFHVALDCVVRNQNDEVVVSGKAEVRAPTVKVSRPNIELPSLHLFDAEARLSDWVDTLKGTPPVRCAVVHPCDKESLGGAIHAALRGLIAPVLIGPRAKIEEAAALADIDISGFTIDDVQHSHAAAARAVELVRSGHCEMMMKGSLHTDEMMHAVLAEPTLRTKRRLSHVFRLEIPTYPKPLLITDAAITIAPTLEEKVHIIQNAILLAHALGIPRPKVAILSAVETVTSSIESTLHAAALCKMADRGQITGAILDGPLAFDNAISAEAARIKGIKSVVSGDADILVVPDMESGNMLAKQLEYMAGAAACGVVVGARVPIALTSRADSSESRVASAALCVRLALHLRRGVLL